MRDSAAESDDAEVATRDQRDRDRQRRKREGDRHKRRVRRSSDHQGDPGNEMAWDRPRRSSVHRLNSREGNARRRASQELRLQRNCVSSPSSKSPGTVDELLFSGIQVRDTSNSDTRRGSTKSVGSVKGKSTKTRRPSKMTAPSSNDNDIDVIISQYQTICDMHMATLLDLKNNLTSMEKDALSRSEKDREFEQIRGWYGALAEKHTRLQKEHQALQEEHVTLQEKYLKVKKASNLNDSFFDFDFVVKKKKDKKEKSSLGDVVWQRAGKIRSKKF